MKISKIISTNFKEGFKRIKVLIMGKDDVQTPYEAAPFGIDGHVPEGWRAIHSETGKKGESIIIGYLNKKQLEGLNKGANRIYSTNESGEDVSTFILLDNDGTMQIGGVGDFMVRFNALEDAFNELKDDYNGHTHDGVIVSVSGGSGAPAVGTPGSTGATDTVSQADITPAKIEEIKTTPSP